MTTSPFDSYRPPQTGRRRPRSGRGEGGRSGQGRGSGGSWLTRDGGGRREMPVVPDAEFTSYYGHNIVKPVPWKHEISAYLFLGGVAGGSGLIQAGAAATGRTVLRRSSRLTAMTAVGLSSVALVADLGRPERFLNMLRTIKLTSPMSVGTWIFSGYAGAASVTTAAEVLDLLPSERRGRLGAALTLADRAVGLAHAPATLGQAILATPLAAYTAVLLSATATPLWHESRHQLPYVFCGSAALASSGVQMVLVPVAEAGPVRRLALMGAVTELIAMHRLEAHLAIEGVDGPLHEGHPATQLRAAKALTIAGAATTLVAGRSRVAAIAGGVALAAASALTRFGVVEAGQESARDPRYTVAPQRRRLAERQARGEIDDSITTAR